MSGYLKDAVLDQLKLKNFKKFIKTRVAVRKKCNLTSMSSKRLESRGFLNPGSV